MSCLLCACSEEIKLCGTCSESYLYDSNIKMIRMKKSRIPSSTSQSESMAELRLHDLICKVYKKKNVFRHVHPLWAISSKGVLLEYDVAVPSERLLIEYDGRQHFEYPNFFHKTKKQFLAQKIRDRLKNKLAKKNGYKLIRFSYKERLDNILVGRKLNVNSKNKYSRR